MNSEGASTRNTLERLSWVYEGAISVSVNLFAALLAHVVNYLSIFTAVSPINCQWQSNEKTVLGDSFLSTVWNQWESSFGNPGLVDPDNPYERIDNNEVSRLIRVGKKLTPELNDSTCKCTTCPAGYELIKPYGDAGTFGDFLNVSLIWQPIGTELNFCLTCPETTRIITPSRPFLGWVFQYAVGFRRDAQYSYCSCSTGVPHECSDPTKAVQNLNGGAADWI